jgi:hypothetical protein
MKRLTLGKKLKLHRFLCPASDLRKHNTQDIFIGRAMQIPPRNKC